MKKSKTAIISLVLALMMAIPTIVIAQPLDDIPKRTENGVVYVPLRLAAYAHGATVEWNGATRTVYIIDVDGHRQGVTIETVGGFIEDGVSWIPLEFANRLFQHSSNNYIHNDMANIALDFMEKFAIGDMPSMLQMMTEEAQATGVKMFAELHQTALLRRGSFIDWDIADFQTVEYSTTFDIAVNSIIGRSVYRVTVNSAGEIAGFSDLGFVLRQMPVDENAAYAVEPVIIGEGTRWALDGILTIPNEASAENPVPAVVLVHGSGPNNMDLSIFDNRPFHDIATYLSSNGIAVLRYDKRTLTHGVALAQAYDDNSFTLWEETIEDAILAAEILQADLRICRVYVAGISLGGILAPRIAEEGNFDGVILLAAPARPLFEISYDQSVQSINDILSAGLMTQEEADGSFAMVAALLEEARNLINLPIEEMQDMLIFGLPAIYQRSWYDSLPIPIILRNTIPTLILHGDRDFQVFTDRDFQRFADYTYGYAHVTAILYDNVNHILMQSQTPYNDLRDYMIPGHVYRRLLRDIVEWIMSN